MVPRRGPAGERWSGQVVRPAAAARWWGILRTVAAPSELPDGIAKKIAVTAGQCWLWTAATDRYGYGKVRWQGKTQFAHRVVYRLLVADPGGASLDHLCRVTGCVNPRHLDPVPHITNVQRGIAAAATKTRYANHTRCPKGHPLSGDNLYAYRTRAGYINKQCRQCRRDTKRARRAAGARD